MTADLDDDTLIDEKFLVSIRNEDRQAFEQLFRKYYASMCSYAATYLEAKEEAEDGVQDVFIYLWNNRRVLNVQTSLRSYLFACVKHQVLNRLKHKAVERNHNRMLTEFWEDLACEEYSEEEQQKIERIREVLKELPPQCYKVFMMSCVEGRKYKDIAEELDISVNTVKYHILRAYRQIREIVTPDNRFTTLLFIACMGYKMQKETFFNKI